MSSAEFRPPSEFHVQDLGITTVRAAMEQSVPHHPDIRVGQDIYEKISDNSIFLYKVELRDGSIEMFAFGEPLDGEGVNALLYFPAPSREFGKYSFDTDDTLSDWENLYLPGNEELLAGHRHIPNWHIFETERLIIRESLLISQDIPHSPKPHHFFVPVMAWKVNAGGQLEWQIDEKKAQAFEQVKATHLKKNVSLAENKYSLLVGALLAASYSPEITTSWEERLTFALKKKTKKEADQDMGATQVLPLVLAWCDQLLESQFVISIEEKMELSTGKRVSLKVPVLPLLESGIEEDETVDAAPDKLPLIGFVPPQLDLYPAAKKALDTALMMGSFIPNPATHMPEDKFPDEKLFPSVTDYLPQESKEIVPYEPLEPFNTIVKLKGSADELDPSELFFTSLLNTVLQDQVVGVKTITMPENIQKKGPWLEAFLSTLNILREDQIIPEGVAVGYIYAILGLLYKMALD